MFFMRSSGSDASIRLAHVRSWVNGFAQVSLKNAVEKYFTAKPQRAQRTYIKNKIHPFGEVVDHTKLNSKPCLSLASLRLCGGNLNSY